MATEIPRAETIVIVDKHLENCRKVIVNKIRNASTPSIHVNPNEVYPFDLRNIVQELKQKGYNARMGYCVCHGNRGIAGLNCGHNRRLHISWGVPASVNSPNIDCSCD